MLLFNVVMYLLAVCLNKHQVVFYVQIKCNTVIQINYNFQGALLYFSLSEVQKFPKILKKFQKDFNKNWPLLPWKCKVENCCSVCPMWMLWDQILIWGLTAPAALYTGAPSLSRCLAGHWRHWYIGLHSYTSYRSRYH